jgi:hypothetical protein
MKVYLKIIFSLACGLTLMLGSMDAAAYTLSPTFNNAGFYLKATLGSNPGTYVRTTYWHPHMENTSGANSAVSDWTLGLLPFSESWGPEGKTSTLGQQIDVDMSANLVSTNAIMGDSAFIHSGFAISADADPPLTTPVVDITVTWGGQIKFNQTFAQIALRRNDGGFSFTSIIPTTNVDLFHPGNQQTFQATLPELSNNYFLTLSLWDDAWWDNPGNYDTSMWIAVTMSVTEAMEPPNPITPIPLPETLTLLGSGLATMLWSQRKRQKRHK